MDFYNSRVASGHLDSFLPDSVDTSRKEQFSLCVPPVPQSFLVEPCINQLSHYFPLPNHKSTTITITKPRLVRRKKKDREIDPSCRRAKHKYTHKPTTANLHKSKSITPIHCTMTHYDLDPQPRDPCRSQSEVINPQPRDPRPCRSQSEITNPQPRDPRPRRSQSEITNPYPDPCRSQLEITNLQPTKSNHPAVKLYLHIGGNTSKAKPFGKWTFELSLSDQMNGTPLASKASASAKSSFGGGVATEPKLTYATDAVLRFSSQERQPLVSEVGCETCGDTRLKGPILRNLLNLDLK
ncbi:hypothetical protein CFP56_004714 [Quercus suber]|uniref:Uncharacterized protein n=1 Tax=Quercus suber TaxID=58331 RepID=A0AAW0MA35_QUESU